VCGDGVAADLGSMAGDAAWERVLVSARAAGTEDVEGHRCDIVEVERAVSGRKMKFRVALSSDAGQYPVRYTVGEAAGESSRVTVRGLKEFTTGAGSVQIPTRVETKDHAAGEVLRVAVDFDVEAKSLKVNESVPAERFVPPAAETVIDVDAGNITRSPPPAPTRPWYFTWWWQLGLLAVVVGGCVWLRRGRAGNTE
jgi:chitodextrinase